MKEQLIQWAQVGDGDCMYKLAKLYQAEGDLQNYVEWLEKSAATKNFDAMKEYADLLRSGELVRDCEKALAIYKELAETFLDEESMENIVDMCERSQCDKDLLRTCVQSKKVV